MELYPLQVEEHVDNCRIGLLVLSFSELMTKLIQDDNIEIFKMMHELNDRLVMIIKDPDGRSIEVSEI